MEDYGPIKPLTWDAWKQSRTKLALRLPGDKFRQLAHYYRDVHDFNDLLDAEGGLPHRNETEALVAKRRLLLWGENIKEWMASAYMVTSDPERTA